MHKTSFPSTSGLCSSPINAHRSHCYVEEMTRARNDGAARLKQEDAYQTTVVHCFKVDCTPPYIVCRTLLVLMMENIKGHIKKKCKEPEILRSGLLRYTAFTVFPGLCWWPQYQPNKLIHRHHISTTPFIFERKIWKQFTKQPKQKYKEAFA